MWKPPERIRYKSLESEWPNASEAASSLLFSQIKFQSLRLTSRTWVPAMVPWRSTESGYVSEDVLDWYERFAVGQPGAIVVEATGIRDIPSGPLLRIGNDSYIDGLANLVRRVRKASQGNTKIFIQLIDFLTIRRRPQRDRYLLEFLEINDHHRENLSMPLASCDEVREKLTNLGDDDLSSVLSTKEWENLTYGYRERVNDTQLEEIANLPEKLPGLFASAAKRAEQAGFDGVELHYAHAYTMASFLSSTNTRQDGFGGDIRNRIKLPIQVFEDVRKNTDKNFVVGCRLLSEEIIKGGGSLSDAKFFALQFAKSGMDFLSFSRGGKFDDAKQPREGSAAYPYTGQSGYECMPGYISDKFGPFGRNLKPVTKIRNHIYLEGYHTPCIVAGGIHTFQQAENILQSDQADIIGFARQALADPDWFEKVRAGRGSSVNLCRYSNYCEGLDQKHKQVTCELWDRKDMEEPNIKKSKDGKRRLIAPAWFDTHR